MTASSMSNDANTYNRQTYDRIWPQMSDYIRYNPGARHRRRHIFEFLERVRFRSLLDVGCGNAELLSLIAQRFPGRQLSGVDLSQVAVDANQARFAQMRFSVANVETEALPGPVDAIVCSEVLEHLDDPTRALRHIRDTLVVGGHAVLTVPTGTVHTTERHFGHIRHPHPDELREQCRAADLEVLDLRVWGFPVYAFTKWATNLKPDAALERFAGEKPYGFVEKAVSTSLTALNYFNFERSARGVQLFALVRRR
jgi:SAM-dependent methyltransferase